LDFLVNRGSRKVLAGQAWVTGTTARYPEDSELRKRPGDRILCEAEIVSENGVNGENTANVADGVIRVFLLDDHEVVRRGVHELLSSEPDITVVGEAGTAADALARIPAARPDVAVLDVRLPDGSGVEVCREIRSREPSTRCLMLTSYADDEALFDAVMAGAAGYALKDIRASDLVGAVRDVAAGKSLLDPVATARVLERLRTGAPEPPPSIAGLTDQEGRILDLIGEGLTNRQIGERLHLAEKTVKNYVSSLLAKLGMERRTQAAAYVARTRAERGRD
jgi:DNA-binding NarL/FixJ family response regulator